MAATRALVRVEAGASIGLGHVRRTASLASALAERGCECVFLAADAASLAAVVPASATVSLSGAPWSSEDVAASAARLREVDARFMVVDSYEATDDYLRGLRDAGAPTVVVRDDGGPVPGDVIVRPAIGANATAAESGQMVCAGAEYALLRPEYWNLEPSLPPSTVTRVVITVGGGDATGLSATLFRSVLRALPEAAVRCVAGPFFTDETRRELAAIAAADAGGRTTVVVSPASPIDLWRDADLVVSGGGQTLYELAALGVPSIAIEVADNQGPQVLALAGAGVTVAVGRADDPHIDDRVAEAVRRVAADSALRAAMHRAGPSLIDGRGALRLADALLMWSAGRAIKN